MASEFDGRSVIVTGAASGIGRATALAFAAKGARVLVADLNSEAAGSVVKEIEEAGGTAVAVTGDLSEQAVVDQVARTAVERFGTVDVLVNNAGIMDRMSALGDVSDPEWERVIRVNLTAPFLLTRAVLPHMLAAGRGAIVNTASEAGLRGSAAGAAYTASKHGVVGLTKSLAVMYRKQGIRANAVAPGGTATSIVVEVDQAATARRRSARTSSTSAMWPSPRNRPPPSSSSPPTRRATSTARSCRWTTAGRRCDAVRAGRKPPRAGGEPVTDCAVTRTPMTAVPVPARHPPQLGRGSRTIAISPGPGVTAPGVGRPVRSSTASAATVTSPPAPPWSMRNR